MADNTEERWSLDGVSLHQFGWSVVTFGGARYDVPPRRGSNITMAGRPGQRHRAKLFDQRTISLVMFLVGMDPATGNAPADGDQRTRFNDSWDFLRRLAARPAAIRGGRVVLTRAWRLTPPYFPDSSNLDVLVHGDPGVPAAGSRLVVADTTAELSSDMAPTMTGRTRADFQMDFTLADPYFYGQQVNATVNVGGATRVWNDGHDVSAYSNMEVDLIGPLTNPKLRNLTPEPDLWVRYNGSIAAGQTVRLIPGQFLAQLITNNNANRIRYVENYGSEFWMELLPGFNKLTLLADSGSGHAVVRFRPPYF